MTSAHAPAPVADGVPACHDCPRGCTFPSDLRSAFQGWERDYPGQRPSELDIAGRIPLSERQFRRLLRQHGLPHWRTARSLMAGIAAGTTTGDVRSPGQLVWEAERDRQGHGDRRRPSSPAPPTDATSRGGDVNIAICDAIG